MEFSEKIIQARKNKAMSQEALAELVGVSRQAVSKWETGEAKPDVDKLIALCDALGLSMDYLCLDKLQESTVHVPELADKRHHTSLKKGLALGLVLGILVGALSVGLVWALQDRPVDAPSAGETYGSDTAQTDSTEGTQADYSHMLAQLDIANLTADTVFLADGTKQIDIGVVPNVDIPGMEVKIQVLNNRNSNTKLYTAEKSRGAYRIELPMSESYDVELMAFFCVGDITVNHRLCRLMGDETGYSMDQYWLVD